MNRIDMNRRLTSYECLCGLLYSVPASCQLTRSDASETDFNTMHHLGLRSDKMPVLRSLKAFKS